jgi:hypothetical protein
MAKRQGRKPPRRKVPVLKPSAALSGDHELVQLAMILSEHKLENNAQGWFSLPWRDGLRAISLARGLALCYSRRQTSDQTSYDQAEDLMITGPRDAEGYHRAEDLLSQIPCLDGLSRATRTALRCFQMFVAHSDRGGHGYNDILRPCFAAEDPAAVVDMIMYWRCLDAIGVSPYLANDKDDRLRRAFTIAWKRGLYHAAYSIKPKGYHMSYSTKPARNAEQ